MGNEFGDILKMPEEVERYISEKKRDTDPVEVNLDSVREHIKRILTTEDFEHFDDEAAMDSIVHGNETEVSENLNLVENLLKSISSEVNVESGPAATMVKALDIDLPDLAQ